MPSANCCNMLYIDIKHQMMTAEGSAWLNVQAEIKLGELVCLFGHSGAGKTTLLRILAGLTRPDKGIIRFNNAVWFDSTNHINWTPQKRHIGLVFQDYALFPNMSVEQNIRYAMNSPIEKKVTELLELFELSKLSSRKPNQLSGGQKQRVALARVLASQPELLLLDEPLSALDFEMRATLQHEILKAHQLLGSATLLVSHDVDEVVSLASSVIVLKNGDVLSKGEPCTVFNDLYGFKTTKEPILTSSCV
jgi:molybdate transport system ATP-binding protein